MIINRERLNRILDNLSFVVFDLKEASKESPTDRTLRNILVAAEGALAWLRFYMATRN